MKYIAHTNQYDEIQEVSTHCKNVAELSRDFAIEELKEICYNIGLLHDAGKYLSDFQKRIGGDSSIHVEHSIVGAKIAADTNMSAVCRLLTQLCVAGHHSGLPDCGTKIDTADEVTLKARLKRDVGDYSDYFKDVSLPEIDSQAVEKFCLNGCELKEDVVEKFSFLTRYCFSCLTDADSLDTAEFVTQEKRTTLKSDFPQCLKKINKKMSSFKAETMLQKSRSIIQNQAYEKSGIDSELYLMNMPTGSGKTLCSIKFALERAITKEKKRIIYVIPYNSIIDQTYEEFQKIFGESANILRHQSTFCFEDESNNTEDATQKLLASENWDADIIITTAVQFFDSVYHNKRGKLRKLHNMADSVIVFDEIHMLPEENLAPCLKSVEYVTSLLNSEAIFLTATMPNYRKLFHKYSSSELNVLDLIDDRSLFKNFKKCTYSFVGKTSCEALLEKLSDSAAALIVVNKRKTARKLFSLCNKNCYHLSTYMTPKDRMRVIEKIKQELKALQRDYPDFVGVPQERKITVISTSLIEAGVDLDFPTVCRELSGLDSILQAGGRCNREGKLKNAEVFVFELDGESRAKSRDLRQEFALGIIRKYDDISSNEAIEEYYEKLFNFNEEIQTSKLISNTCNSIDRLPFASYKFEMINSNQFSIFVPHKQDEESEKLYSAIRAGVLVPQRKIQKYCCSIYENEFKELLRQGVIDDFGTGISCLTNADYYDNEIGIKFEGNDYYL